MGILRRSAGIILIGAVTLAVLTGVISWFRMTPEDRSVVLSLVGRSIAWIGIVLVLPFATYFASTAVSRRDSNTVSGLLVGAYTLVDILLLGWLMGFTPNGPLAGAIAGLGILIAATYNLLVCDWIAEKMSH